MSVTSLTVFVSYPTSPFLLPVSEELLYYIPVRYRGQAPVAYTVDKLFLAISWLISYTLFMEKLLVRFTTAQRVFIRKQSKKYKMSEAEIVRKAIEVAIIIEKNGA